MKKSVVIEKIGWLFIIVAFLFDLYCAYIIWGLTGIVVGIFVAPVFLIAVPFYMLFKYGVWLSLIFTAIGFLFILVSVITEK